MTTIDAEMLSRSIPLSVKSDRPIFMATYSYDSYSERENEFLFFLKPELNTLDKSFGDVFQLILRKFEEFEVSIQSGVVLPASYLKRHSLIALHYGMINRVSRLGSEAFGPEALQNLAKLRESTESEFDVLGAHQFLDQYPAYSSRQLCDDYASKDFTRLSGGTYGAFIEVNDRLILLLNGFHPIQLEHFEAEGASISCFACVSPRSWTDLRQKMTGSTNPRNARSGSIRSELLKNMAKFQLQDVSPTLNGIHVSAGPIEAAVEIARYMSNQDTGKTIDPLLTTSGRIAVNSVGARGARYLLNDGIIGTPLGLRSAFDATEECDVWRLSDVISQFRLDAYDSAILE